MDHELAKLVDMARGGVLDLFQQLVNELRARSYEHPEVLVEFARAPEEICRRAAIQAAAGRTEDVVLDAMNDLASDPVPYVRQSLAYALTDHPSWPLDAAADLLLADPDSNVRQAAVWCARCRPALLSSLLKRLRIEDNAWVRGEV